MPRLLDKQGIKNVLSNYNQTVAYFPGTVNTPIIQEISREEAVELLNNATTNDPISGPAKDLLHYMGEHDWCITAGVHEGGLGGAAGGADPEPHISLSCHAYGYHLRVSNNKKKKMWILWDITGPAEGTPGGIRLSKGKQAAAAKAAPPVVTTIDQFQEEFALTEREAMRAFNHWRRAGGTKPQAIAWLREQST